MTRKRSLAGQSFMLAGSTAFAQVLYVVLTTLMVSRSTPSEFGAIAIALGAGGFLAGIMDFGFTAFSVRELAAGRMSYPIYWLKLAMKISFVAGIAGIALIGMLFSSPSLGVTIAIVAIGRTVVMGVNAPLTAEQKFSHVATVLVAERTVALGFFLICWFALPSEIIPGFWFATALGSAAAGIFGLAFGYCSRQLPKGWSAKSPWTGVAGYGAFSLALSGSMLDVVLLGLCGGSLQAGLYGAVSRWTQPVMLMSQAFSSAIAPTVGSASSSRAAFEAVRSYLWIPTVGLFACLTLVIFSPVAVPLLIGEDYLGSGPVLVTLAIGAGAVLINQPLATFLQYRGHDRLVGAAFAATVLFHLLFVLVASKSFGAFGTAVSYASSQAALMAILGVAAVLLKNGVAKRIRLAVRSHTRRTPAASRS